MAKTRTSFFIEPEVKAALEALRARDGISEGEAIRRAIVDFLKVKRIAVEPPKKGGTKPKK
jgi:hypothetical protein